jgi:hypothetical protein
MRAYRVYALDREGLVVRARLIEARADEEAVGAATEFGWPRWQVWRSVRLIKDSTETRMDEGILSDNGQAWD